MHFFQQIYDAALNFDSNQIKKLMAKGAAINQRYRARTPAGQLALDGYLRAAEFLILFGADVEEIAAALAFSGHTTLCEDFRKQYPFVSRKMATHAIAGGHFSYGEKLLTDGTAELEDLYIGSILGNHVDYQCTPLFQNYSNALQDEGKLQTKLDMAKAFITVGNIKKYNAIVTDLKTNHPNGIPIDFNEEMLGVEAIRNPEKFKHFFVNLPIDQQKAVARGAAIGGYLEYAQSLLAEKSIEPTFIQDIAEIALEYGHFIFAQRILIKFKDINLNQLSQRALAVGHFAGLYFVLGERAPLEYFQARPATITLIQSNLPTPELFEYALAALPDRVLRLNITNQINNAKVTDGRVYTRLLDDKSDFISALQQYQVGTRLATLLRNPTNHEALLKLNAKSDVDYSAGLPLPAELRQIVCSFFDSEDESNFAQLINPCFQDPNFVRFLDSDASTAPSVAACESTFFYTPSRGSSAPSSPSLAVRQLLDLSELDEEVTTFYLNTPGM